MNQKGFANIILIVVAVLVIGGIGYFALVKKSEPVVIEQSTPTPQIDTNTPIPTGPEPQKKTEEGVQEGGAVKGRLSEISVAKRLIMGSHPKFSYDGTKILFRREGSGDDGLWVVNVDGSGFRKLTSEIPIGEGTYDFGWSYDDGYVFYITVPLGGTDRLNTLKVIDLSTNDVRTLFTAPPNFLIRPARWLGQYQIAFVLEDRSGGGFFPPPPSAIVKLVDVRGESVEPIQNVELYYWRDKEGVLTSSVIALVNTTGEIKDLTPPGAISVPSVGPKAEKIAYRNLQGIVVMDGDGNNARLILSEPGRGGVSLFSPDGKKLLYGKTKDDGHYITESDIYMINLDGSGEKRLTNSGEKLATEPSWSANGKKIVFFYSGAADKQIAILEVE